MNAVNRCVNETNSFGGFAQKTAIFPRKMPIDGVDRGAPHNRNIPYIQIASEYSDFSEKIC